MRFNDRSVHTVEETLINYQIDCDYEPVGNITCGVHAGHRDLVTQTAALADGLGVDVSFLTEQEMRQRRLPEAFQFGVLDPRGGHLNPGKYVMGLRRAALAAGVRIFENTRVTRIDETQVPVLVTTDTGSVRADKAIIASNGYTPVSLGRLKSKIFPIRVTLVRFPVVNALTLPGGEIIILSGLLDKAESGDAVIGVLAHEIAHAVRRDPLQVSIKQTGAALMVSLLVGDVFGGAALSGVASSLVENGYSRDAEAAADFLAVTAMNQLGLTAVPLGDFVAGMDRDNPLASVIPSFLNTHPSGENRRRDILALSQGHGRAMSSYDWRSLKNMCR